MKMGVSKDVYHKLLSYAEDAVPSEACGLLAGNDAVVKAFYPMTNSDASSEHYSMIPEEQFSAVKDMREKGLQMLAIWHSHPETPARMSEEDIKLAYTPELAYLILSLAEPSCPSLKGYRMNDGIPVELSVEVMS